VPVGQSTRRGVGSADPGSDRGTGRVGATVGFVIAGEETGEVMKQTFWGLWGNRGLGFKVCSRVLGLPFLKSGLSGGGFVGLADSA